MKGVIQAYALFVLLLGVSLGFMIYIRFDAILYMSRFILNQSIHETMVMILPLSLAERKEVVGDLVNQNISLRKDNDLDYHIEVLGFHPDPLALRVRMTVSYLGENSIILKFDETMIEVES
jgi:hypothetical protein